MCFAFDCVAAESFQIIKQVISDNKVIIENTNPYENQ